MDDVLMKLNRHLQLSSMEQSLNSIDNASCHLENIPCNSTTYIKVSFLSANKDTAT